MRAGRQSQQAPAAPSKIEMQTKDPGRAEREFSTFSHNNCPLADGKVKLPEGAAQSVETTDGLLSRILLNDALFRPNAAPAARYHQKEGILVCNQNLADELRSIGWRCFPEGKSTVAEIPPEHVDAYVANVQAGLKKSNSSDPQQAALQNVQNALEAAKGRGITLVSVDAAEYAMNRSELIKELEGKVSSNRNIKAAAELNSKNWFEAARTVRSHLKNDPRMASDAVSFLELKQLQYRAEEGYELVRMYEPDGKGGRRDVPLKQWCSNVCRDIESKVSSNGTASFEFGTGEMMLKDSKNPRLRLLADADRAIAGLRMTATERQLETAVVPHKDGKSVTVHFRRRNSAAPAAGAKLPDKLRGTLKVLTMPPGGVLDSGRSLKIGQGYFGDCYLFAAVISMWERAPFRRHEILNRIKFTPEDRLNIGVVKSSRDGDIYIRRSDFIRQIIDREVIGCIGSNAGSGAITKTIPPPELLMLELGMAESRVMTTGSGNRFKGIAARGGFSREFLTWLTGRKPLALHSDGRPHAAGYDAYSSTPFSSNPHAMKRLEEILGITARDRQRYALAAASLEGQGVILTPSGENGKIYRNHAYAILDYDLQKQELTLANPWHSDEPFKMPLKEFAAAFSLIEATDLNKQAQE